MEAEVGEPPRRWLSGPGGRASLVPLLCGLHCAATPLLVLVAPTLAIGAPGEWLLLTLSAGLATAALIRAPGVGGAHQRGAVVPVVTGLALWAAALAGVPSGIPEAALSAPGAGLVALGMIWNARAHCAFPQGRVERVAPRT